MVSLRRTHISPNMEFYEDPRFGAFDRATVFALLCYVDLELSQALGKPEFSTCTCHILYHPDNPMCSPFGKEEHLIYLSPQDYYGGQWLYQFAHEYCHHLINGELTGEIVGLTWFEETICSLSSLYVLHKASSQKWIQANSHLHRDILGRLEYLQQDMNIPGDTPLPIFLQSKDNLLKEERYHRDLYKAIAAKMFPLFRKNPNLWKIILHFGNMKERDSLTDLFQDLSKFVDSSYSDSFQKLQNLLIS